MNYYAKNMKQVLRTVTLNEEFFGQLDEFTLYYIESCFVENFNQNIGLMTEIEKYNYELYRSYRIQNFEQKYGLYEDFWKKAS